MLIHGSRSKGFLFLHRRDEELRDHTDIIIMSTFCNKSEKNLLTIQSKSDANLSRHMSGNMAQAAVPEKPKEPIAEGQIGPPSPQCRQLLAFHSLSQLFEGACKDAIVDAQLVLLVLWSLIGPDWHHQEQTNLFSPASGVLCMDLPASP